MRFSFLACVFVVVACNVYACSSSSSSSPIADAGPIDSGSTDSASSDFDSSKPTGCVSDPTANCPASQSVGRRCYDGALPPNSSDAVACSPPTTITDGVDVWCCAD